MRKWKQFRFFDVCNYHFLKCLLFIEKWFCEEKTKKWNEIKSESEFISLSIVLALGQPPSLPLLATGRAFQIQQQQQKFGEEKPPAIKNIWEM